MKVFFPTVFVVLYIVWVYVYMLRNLCLAVYACESKCLLVISLVIKVQVVAYLLVVPRRLLTFLEGSFPITAVREHTTLAKMDVKRSDFGRLAFKRALLVSLSSWLPAAVTDCPSTPFGLHQLVCGISPAAAHRNAVT